MDSFLNTRLGAVIHCEGGYFTGAHLSGAAFDTQGKKIRDFGPTTWEAMDSGHLANFVAATRSRKVADLNADVLQGHLSATCCHLATSRIASARLQRRRSLPSGRRSIRCCRMQSSAITSTCAQIRSILPEAKTSGQRCRSTPNWSASLVNLPTRPIRCSGVPIAVHSPCRILAENCLPKPWAVMDDRHP
jgi:hypothetical protein